MNLFKWLKPRNFSRSAVSVDTIRNIKREWQNIDILVKGGQPSQLRQALIVADKSLDNVLRDIVSGETMGERLKNAKDVFNDWDFYQKIWEAHKIRNNLVHQVGYEPPHQMLKNAIRDLKNGLQSLGVHV